MITEDTNGTSATLKQTMITAWATRKENWRYELVRACVDDVIAFVANTELSDDRTLMALRRV